VLVIILVLFGSLLGAQNQSPAVGAPTMGCTSGQEYFQSDAADGENKWFCNAKGVWVQLVPAGASIPTGSILLIVSGSCPSGFEEESSLNGKTLLGTLAGNKDIGTSGGSDTLTASGTVSQPTFTGNAGVTSLVSAGTPSGTVSQPTFTGNTLSGGSRKGGTSNPASIIENGAAVTGTISQPTFTGNALADHQHSLTPAGAISQPTFTGNQADNRSAYVKVIFCRKL